MPSRRWRHVGRALLMGALLMGCSNTAIPPVTPAPSPPAPPSPAVRPTAAVPVTPAPTPAAPTPAPAPPKAPKPEEQPSVAKQPADDPYFVLERCPPEMTLLPGNVCIDRWEASLVQLLKDGSERRWSPFKSLKGGRLRLAAVSKPGVIPQGYINGHQAAAACKASGKRLCRVDEWVAACRGPEDTQFPYGAKRRKGACNDDGRSRHPVSEASRRLGWTMDRMWREGMDHPVINQLSNTVEKTGHHQECTNDYGVYDMVGNLHEWIADSDGTFRGGYFMDTKINGDGCDYATTAHSMGYHDYSIGFRCCKDASDK